MPKRVLGLLTLTELFASIALAQSSAPRTVFTDAQATAGKAAYESVCVNCHTYKLTGRRGEPDESPSLDSLPEMFRKGIQEANGKIPALAGKAFMDRWGSRTTQALSNRIATAIGGFPPAGLDDNTANNLAAYFLKTSGVPAGTQELGADGTFDVLIRDLASGSTSDR